MAINSKLSRLPEAAIKALAPWLNLEGELFVMQPSDREVVVIWKDTTTDRPCYVMAFAFKIGDVWQVSCDEPGSYALDPILEALERRIRY